MISVPRSYLTRTQFIQDLKDGVYSPSDDGEVIWAAGFPYVLDSTATGVDSVGVLDVVDGGRPHGNYTPFHFGGVWSSDMTPNDSTDALNACLAAYHRTTSGQTCDWSGSWGVSGEVLFDQDGDNNRTHICGTIKYIGASDIDTLIYLKDVRGANFEGFFDVDCGGATSYDSRKVTDAIVSHLAGQATFGAGRVKYTKRHAWNTGGKPTDSGSSHIGLMLGHWACYNIGSAGYSEDPTSNIRLKQYDFTGRVDSGGATSTLQRTTVTITGGIDVLQEGGSFRLDDKFYWIDSVDDEAGTITFFPWIGTTQTTGTISSCHGSAFRNWGGNSASLVIQGLKCLGCGVGFDAQGLYGATVSVLETQVVGVSYLQKGLNYGQQVNVFHPETPEGAVDILKCDGYETRTTIRGASVYRGQDIIQLAPMTTSGASPSTTINGIWFDTDMQIGVGLGQRIGAGKRVTSITLENTGSNETVVLRNRTNTTVSLERDIHLPELVGATDIKITRLGDSSNATAGPTAFEPTPAESALGVTVNGAATCEFPAMPNGTMFICSLDVTRNNWEISAFIPAQFEPAIIDVTGGANVDEEARAAINEVLSVMRTHGMIGD